MRQVQPLPFPFQIDSALANQGQSVFTNHCASCHALGGARTGQVISLSEVATDPNRAQHWTEEAAVSFNEFAEQYSWDFDQFRDTNGYTASTLKGIWARAPYLHNGSVPSLVDLLAPSQSRPSVFYRGYDLYDPEKVGFVSSGAQAETDGFRVDTAAVGNDNQGHLYGTDLPQADKKSLVEYLKTL